MHTSERTNALGENSSYKQTFKVLVAFLFVWKCGNTTQGWLLLCRSAKQTNRVQISSREHMQDTQLCVQINMEALQCLAFSQPQDLLQLHHTWESREALCTGRSISV